MVLNHWSRRCDLVGRISGTSFFIVILVIIKSSPETIKQIRYLLNYEVSNTKTLPMHHTYGTLNKNQSQDIILSQEICSLPINDVCVGCLCRMNVKLVKNHHLFVIQVEKRPLVFLAVWGNVSGKRRVAGLCKLNPHFTHDF